MAPQLDAAQRILIKTLLAQGFETRLIASKTSCTVRTVQRIRLERQQSKTSNRRTRVGRRGCVTSTMRKALCDTLAKQPYLYRDEMADFLFQKFGRRISERSIGRTLRSIGWTRKTIRRIAQQRDTDLRDHYRSTSPTNLSLSMNLAATEGRDTGVGDGLRRGPPPSRLRSSVEEKDGTFSQHTRKVVSC